MISNNNIASAASRDDENKKIKVIVIGAGLGSIGFLKESFKYTDYLDITVISPTGYSEESPNLIANLFTKGDEEFIARYNKVVSLNAVQDTVKLYGKYIKQVVTNISHDKVVTLGDGSQIVGDVIIASTGLKLDEFWRPLAKGSTPSDRMYQLIEFRRNVELAQSILVIGGGIVAVELVGELITKFPNKEVHMVQSGDRLLQRQSIKASNAAQRSLQSNGAIIHLNHYAIKQGDGYVLKRKLDDGDVKNLVSWERANAKDPYVFTPDLVINCGGGKPITDYFPKQVINEYGEVKVDEYLQVIGMPDIYAIGDINDVKFSMKCAQGATAQGVYLFKQVLQKVKNNTKTNISNEPFKAPAVVAIVTLGDSAALIDTPKFSLVGWFGTGSIILRWMRRSLEILFRFKAWPNDYINNST